MSDLSPLFTWRSAITDSDLSPDTRHVALTLSLHMNERGDSCFPSLETLRQETGRRKASVILGLRELEARGWLRVKRPKVTGRGRPNHYTAIITPKGFRGRTDSEGYDGGTDSETERVPKPTERVPGQEGKGTDVGPVGRKALRTSQAEDVSLVPSLPLALAVSEEAQAACVLLAEGVGINTSKPPPAITPGWLRAARLLHERDGYGWEEIAAVIRWALADAFWAPNVLSMEQLRAKRDGVTKFDKIRAQMRRAPGGKDRGITTRELVERQRESEETGDESGPTSTHEVIEAIGRRHHGQDEEGGGGAALDAPADQLRLPANRA